MAPRLSLWRRSPANQRRPSDADGAFANKCIGCGLCTTRCEFDAIHLRRDNPEASTMWRTKDKVKAVLPYAAKRGVRILRGKADRRG